MAELRVKVEAPIGGLQLRADVTLREPWMVLFGPSGSGKSSILRLIAGLWTPPNATLQLGNEDLTNVPAYRRGIDKGGPYPYAKDGSIFSNREGQLPKQKRGYYREYTVKTPGERTRGARRIISGGGGELYYTDDHYNHFRRIAR